MGINSLREGPQGRHAIKPTDDLRFLGANRNLSEAHHRLQRHHRLVAYSRLEGVSLPVGTSIPATRTSNVPQDNGKIGALHGHLDTTGDTAGFTDKASIIDTGFTNLKTMSRDAIELTSSHYDNAIPEGQEHLYEHSFPLKYGYQTRGRVKLALVRTELRLKYSVVIVHDYDTQFTQDITWCLHVALASKSK